MKKLKIFKDKKGNKLTFKEFITRWKIGIEGITPLQKTKVQLTGTKITLIGLFLGLCVTIYGWKNLWWVAIILTGAILNTGVQYLATKQQKKLYQTIEDNFKEASEDDNSQGKKGEDSSSGNHLETRSTKEEDNIARDMSGVVDNHPDTSNKKKEVIDVVKNLQNKGKGGEK